MYSTGLAICLYILFVACLDDYTIPRRYECGGGAEHGLARLLA